MRARGWFHCTSCRHRARAVVGDHLVVELMVEFDRDFLRNIARGEPKASDADYRGTARADRASLPSLDEHPALARVLAMATCPACGARDRRALAAGWARASLRGLTVFAVPPVALLLAYFAWSGFNDVRDIFRLVAGSRDVLLLLAFVSATIGVVTVVVAAPRADRIARWVQWE